MPEFQGRGDRITNTMAECAWPGRAHLGRGVTRMWPASIPLDDLAQRCAEQTQHFNRRQDSDPRFCFELLRRALAEGVADAFAWVCSIYENQVTHWVYRHPSFDRTGESAEYFANAALTQFYFALRGPKFEKVPTLGQVLAYLKACVHSAVAQYARDQVKAEWVTLDEQAAGPTPDLGRAVEAREVWAHICRLLTNERDQRLAQAVFVLELKPSEIVAAYPGLWRDQREVSVELYRIRRRLRQDAALRATLGVPAAEPDL